MRVLRPSDFTDGDHAAGEPDVLDGTFTSE
jgi:hypothetical protein